MNKTKQKAIIKKLYRELDNRSEFIGYHDYREIDNTVAFISPYRAYFTSETYDEFKAPTQFKYSALVPDIKEMETIGVNLDNLKVYAKEFKPRISNPYILKGFENSVSVNPKFLLDAFDWCGKNTKVYIHKKKENERIWIEGDDGKVMILPIRK